MCWLTVLYIFRSSFTSSTANSNAAASGTGTGQLDDFDRLLNNYSSSIDSLASPLSSDGTRYLSMNKWRISSVASAYCDLIWYRIHTLFMSLCRLYCDSSSSGFSHRELCQITSQCAHAKRCARQNQVFYLRQLVRVHGSSQIRLNSIFAKAISVLDRGAFVLCNNTRLEIRLGTLRPVRSRRCFTVALNVCGYWMESL